MFQVPVSPHPSCSVAQGSLFLWCLTLVQLLWWVFESMTLTESVIIAFLRFNTSTLTDGIRRISGALWISKVMLTAKSFLLLTGVRTIPGVLLLPASFTLPTNGAAVWGARPVLGVHAPDKNLKRQQLDKGTLCHLAGSTDQATFQIRPLELIPTITSSYEGGFRENFFVFSHLVEVWFEPRRRKEKHEQRAYWTITQASAELSINNLLSTSILIQHIYALWPHTLQKRHRNKRDF